MRQVPDVVVCHSVNEASEELTYSPLIDPDPIDNRSCNHYLTWFANYHAFAPKTGDFSTNYFNFLKILEIALLCVEPLEDEDDLYPEIKAACYIMAFYFALNSLANDLLLYIPPEEAEKIYNYLSRTSPDSPLAENKTNNRSCFMSIARPLGYCSIYAAFAILSANSSVGMLAAFPQSLLAKILATILAALGTELGIFYSHMVFSPRIEQFIDLIKSGHKNFSATARCMRENFMLIMDLLKSFGMISLYYTIMGIFYLYSLVEQLSDAFGFDIDDLTLNIGMITAGLLVFLTNIVIRFPANLKKCFAPYASTQEIKMDIFFEAVISSASFALSIRHLSSNQNMAITGITASVISLTIGLRAIYLRAAKGKPTDSPSNHQYSFLTNWLNGHSRFIKSTLLPFAAVSKVIQMLKSHSNIDCNFDTVDIALIALLLGMYVGKNNSNMYKRSIDTHLRYLQEKWAIEKEAGGLFGRFCCLFTPSKAYPEIYLPRLTTILNS